MQHAMIRFLNCEGTVCHEEVELGDGGLEAEARAWLGAKSEREGEPLTFVFVETTFSLEIYDPGP